LSTSSKSATGMKAIAGGDASVRSSASTVSNLGAGPRADRELADGLGQSPDPVSEAIGRAARRKDKGQAFRQRLGEVGKAVVARGPILSANNSVMPCLSPIC
jgi:hypothetical protein